MKLTRFDKQTHLMLLHHSQGAQHIKIQTVIKPEYYNTTSLYFNARKNPSFIFNITLFIFFTILMNL